MLSHQNRFHGHGSVRYVFQHGQVVRSMHFVVRYTHNPRRVHSRAAVIVSKKIHKSAVKRNRVRRRVFEILRHNWTEFAGVYDLTITVVSAEVLVMTHSDLLSEIRSSLHKAQIIIDSQATPRPM